jgi:ATP-dependent exoDNAse (exonuclease V) beta subunit
MPSQPLHQLENVVISASAGSGKTYQLVRRFLHLMTLGVEPQRIAAMTFTRKASGEFFNRILNRLAELAQGTLDPAKYFAGMRPQPPHWPDFSTLLRNTTQSIQRLRLSTLDSFFANVTACFPLELGLPLGASVMAEDEAGAAREEAVGSMIEHLFRKPDEEAIRSLVEAFKQATFGSEEKRAADSLNQWIESGHDRWMEGAGASSWGDPTQIWPTGAAARKRPIELTQAVQQLRAAFDADNVFTAKGAEAWEHMLDEVIKTEPGLNAPKPVSILLGACAVVWSDLKNGKAEISIFRNKREIHGTAAKALVTVCETLLARELLVRCHRTQGTASMISRYEDEYARRVRNLGRLSFADVQRLLARAADAWLHQNEGASLWYRLDSRYDHWLFDEFQDTSFQQWHVVGGLVEEVLQSSGGERSFFAVGDPKQSIYLWRQAEPRLFEKVRKRDGVIVERLSESRRSAQEVLDAVNLACNEEQIATLLPGAAKLWEFQEHRSATKLRGYSALLWPAAVESDQPTANDVTLGLLREVSPLARGMTCAVLVRGNDTARELADLIRAELGMETVCESEQQPSTDNAVTIALLSILQYAAHPGDRFALEHLQMTPIQCENWSDTIRETLRAVFDDGFTGFVKLWMPRLREAMPAMDAFTALRLEQFGDLAAEFDGGGSRDIDAFIRFAKASRLRTRGAGAAIQVMTIHAAKGLEFDMVVLPELSPNSSMNSLRPRSLIAKRNDEGRLEWVLQEPPKDFVMLDDVLKNEREEAGHRTEFESLCRLYVAMTRAKRGLYLVLEKPPGESAKAMNEARLLRTLLGDTASRTGEMDGIQIAWSFERGKRSWFESDPLKPAIAPAPAPHRQALGELLRTRQPLPQRRTPSGEESFKVKGSVMWSTGRDSGQQLGTLVHKLMEQVEWIGADFDDDTLNAAWRKAGLDRDADFEKAREHALNVIRSVSCRGAFTKPAGQSRLWRERPFDLMLEDQRWISGTFDRVNIACDADGRALSATIIDFKTDDVADDGALAEKQKGYASQIALYRNAVVRLTGLPPTKVQASLLFTRTARLISMV